MLIFLVDGVLQTPKIARQCSIKNWICHCLCYCPLVWCSKLQTGIALLTVEAEYIAMSHALREAMPVQKLVKENNCIFDIPNPITDICITCHEDNLSAIAMAESLKFTPWTKHIAINYHHFLKQSANIFQQIR
jgi:hypothetical protein